MTTCELMSEPVDPATVLSDARRIARVRLRGVAVNDADDIAQEAVVRYLERWHGQAPDNPAAWLETTIARLVIDRGRRVKRRPGDEPAVQVFDDLVASMRSQEYASLVPVQEALIQRVLALVSDADAAILRLRLLQGLTAAEAADDLGLSVAAVEQRTKRARDRLRAALQARPQVLEELRSGHPSVYAVT
ncbi:sigma-70 family RNA polymerase sigma factor [Nocardioidaceae bacterium]|nr:sigma-70 family RNA polymerase sigma factor [Nocardioidaceae bacterium]